LIQIDAHSPRKFTKNIQKTANKKKVSKEWTGDEIETIKSLWISGIGSPKIAEKIGRTRNAVMGKLNRLGLLHKNQTTKDKELENTIEEKPLEEPLVNAEHLPYLLYKGKPQNLKISKPSSVKESIEAHVHDEYSDQKTLSDIKTARVKSENTIIMEWLKESYPGESEYYQEMLIITAGALVSEITPVLMAQKFGVLVNDARTVREAMIAAGLWNKDAGDLSRYDGKEGWLQLVLEAMMVKGEIELYEGKWYLPGKTPRTGFW
jgi:hypothetical protein